jgi:hypothetical protein
MAGFGPDGNLPLSDVSRFTIQVPTGFSADLTFSSDAFNENAICIYSDDGTKIIERGNHGRSKAPAQFPLNNSPNAKQYLITGWNKNGPPDGSKPWQPSKFHLVSDGIIFTIGYEDLTNGDNDFNDMVVTVRLKRG